MSEGFDLNHLFGASAAVSAAMATGLLSALLANDKSAEEHAKDLSLDARTTRRVLDVLVAFDVAARVGDRYGASPALKKMAKTQPVSLDQLALLWNHVPEALRTGRPAYAMDAAPQKREALYANVVPGLGRMFAAAARDLAARLDGEPKRVLDVGCGSGVWSLAIGERFRGARVTGLDLPDVLAAFKVRAAEMGLADRIDTIPGDMHTIDIPARAFDLVVIANVLRIEEPERARRVLARGAEAVAPGGALIVVDAFSDGTQASERALRIYALHLTLRTEKGRIYEASDVKGWMTEAGLSDARELTIEGNPGAAGALIARRPA